MRLRVRAWAADWASCQAEQAGCACLLSFINFPWMTVRRRMGRERRAERVVAMSNSDSGG